MRLSAEPSESSVPNESECQEDQREPITSYVRSDEEKDAMSVTGSGIHAVCRPQ